MRKLPGRGYSADFWKACMMNLLCMTGQAVMFLLTLYFTHAGMTRWQVGTTDAVFWIISVLIQPWLGRRIDRWGRRVFFIWGSYLMVGSILCIIPGIIANVALQFWPYAVVDEDKGTCRVELIDFGAASGTKEAA